MRRYVFRLAILSLFVLTHGTVWAGDQEIAQQIIEKLQAEKKAGSLKGFSIDLQVDEGTVWLSGRVANEQQQARALDLARRVGGVKQVVNDLSIAPPKVASAKAPASSAQASPAQFGANEYYAGAVAEEPTPATSPAPTQQFAQQVAQQPAQQPTYYVEPQSQSRASEELARQPAAPQLAYSEQAAPPTIAVEAVPIEATDVEATPIEVAPEPAPIPRAVLRSASVRQRVAAATGSSPVGSGVDGAASSYVQAAQPVANIPQPVATAESLQPMAAQPAQQQMAMVPMQMPYMVPVYAGSTMQVPLAMAPARHVNYNGVAMAQHAGAAGAPGAPVPMYMPGSGVGIAPARYDHPTMPGYAWPSYAAYPNYAAVTYPKQYSPTAWPYIGPFYPYPQVPLGWRKVTMEWDDGWWMLDFKDRRTMYNH